MKHVFPKWFYHKEFFPEGKIIHSQAEFDLMPVGFVESYGDLDNQMEIESVENQNLEDTVDLKETVKKARTKKGK